MISTKTDIAELTQIVPCPQCGSTIFKLKRPAHYPSISTREDLLKIYSSSSDHKLMDQLSECRDCSLIYLNPRIKDDIIISSYKNSIDPVFFEQNPMRIKTFKNSLKKIIHQLEIDPNPNNWILDVGCAGGAFPKAASDLGFSAIGVEPSPWLCEEGKKAYNLDLRPGLLHEQDFGSKKFSLVTLWDVIEHLTNPEDVLLEIKSLLKENGILVVNYPDYASWIRRLFGFKWPFFLSVHLIYFTPSTIRHFLIKSGFEVISITPHFQALELGYILQRASHIFKPFSLIHTLVRILRMGKLPFWYNLGQSMVIAKKI